MLQEPGVWDHRQLLRGRAVGEGAVEGGKWSREGDENVQETQLSEHFIECWLCLPHSTGQLSFMLVI